MFTFVEMFMRNYILRILFAFANKPYWMDSKHYGVYNSEDLSKEFLDAINGKVHKISFEERARIKQNYEIMKSILKKSKL